MATLGILAILINIEVTFGGGGYTEFEDFIASSPDDQKIEEVTKINMAESMDSALRLYFRPEDIDTLDLLENITKVEESFEKYTYAANLWRPAREEYCRVELEITAQMDHEGYRLAIAKESGIHDAILQGAL
jgi:hypothetical protein